MGDPPAPTKPAANEPTSRAPEPKVKEAMKQTLTLWVKPNSTAKAQKVGIIDVSEAPESSLAGRKKFLKGLKKGAKIPFELIMGQPEVKKYRDSSSKATWSIGNYKKVKKEAFGWDLNFVTL